MTAAGFASDVATIWYREWLRFIRKPTRIVGSFVTPIVWMAMFGYGMQRGLKLTLPFPGFRGTYLDWTAPGIIAMGMLFSGIFTGMAIVFERQFGFLKEILVAPVARSSFVIGKGLGGMTTGIIQGLTILLLSILVFGLRFTAPHGWIVGVVLALALMALLGVSIVNLGVAIAARMQSHEVFMLIANFLVMPMFFLSGAIYPVRNLPTALRVVIAFNPLHYAVDGLRYALFGGVVAEHALLVDVGALALFATLTTALAAKLFQKF